MYWLLVVKKKDLELIEQVHKSDFELGINFIFDGFDLNDYETEKKIDENNKSSTSITIAKRIIIGILIITTIMMICFGYIYLAIISIASSIIIWIYLTIEVKKIDLLEEISQKLNQTKS